MPHICSRIRQTQTTHLVFTLFEIEIKIHNISFGFEDMLEPLFWHRFRDIIYKQSYQTFFEAPFDTFCLYSYAIMLSHFSFNLPPTYHQYFYTTNVPTPFLHYYQSTKEDLSTLCLMQWNSFFVLSRITIWKWIINVMTWGFHNHKHQQHPNKQNQKKKKLFLPQPNISIG